MSDVYNRVVPVKKRVPLNKGIPRAVLSSDDESEDESEDGAHCCVDLPENLPSKIKLDGTPVGKRTQKCNRCQHIKAMSCFGLHSKTGQPLKKCKDCTAYAKAYNQSAAGKAVIRKFDNSSHRKEWRAEWLLTQNGAESIAKGREKAKPRMAEYNKTPERRARNNETRKAPHRREKTNASTRLWRQTPNGQASSKASDHRKYVKMMSDPGTKLMERIRIKVTSMLTNRPESHTVASYTGFESAADLAHHMEMLMPKDSGMTLANHGEFWHIEHAIARCWYDPNDVDDIRRCWSKANVRPMLGPENLKKNFLIQDAECAAIDPMYWPASWNGKIPSDAEKKAMYKGLRGGR